MSHQLESESPSSQQIIRDSIQTKIAKGKELKELGNAAYKAAAADKTALTTALRKYHEAVNYFSGLDNAQFNSMVPGKSDTAALSEAEKADIDVNLIACYNNMAACLVKLERWDRVVANTNQVLKKFPENTKALFRRGQAYLNLNDLAKAEADLTKANALAPNDSGIKTELAKLKKRNSEYEKKQKKEWAGLFDRMAASHE
ncbi:hypothetical protein HK100_012255 [Physocladia obscura]|uniref:TPR-like protein n=1 Tax=Physocladia obscura TaxID=109957 RepID=A0AAD5XHR2_9FUNG|nr:hypothetical protein HK100_012255 [Physocladia obscura]